MAERWTFHHPATVAGRAAAFQPPFFARHRSLLDRVWRLFLLVGLFLWAVTVPVDAVQRHWSDVGHDAIIAGVYWLIISFERTLDRWEPFVPPSVRGRRP